LPRCLPRRNLAHRLAKPCLPRVLSEPRMPDHQEMKWTHLVWRFHEPRGGISFHHLPHAIARCEDEFRAIRSRTDNCRSRHEQHALSKTWLKIPSKSPASAERLLHPALGR
jgi:hypothetical protein